MKKTAVRIVLVLLLLALAGLGYSQAKLLQARTALERERLELERKVSLLEKRYAEKRALESQLTRVRIGLEGRLRALQGEVETLARERDELKNVGQALVSELARAKEKVSGLEKDLELERAQSKGLQIELDVARKKHEKTISDHEREIAGLVAEKEAREAELNDSLRAASQRAERYEGHNARLMLLARDLLEAYQNKGVSTSVLQAEPFTQIKRVEMEHFEQEYMGRIEKEKIRRSQTDVY